jgi:hypothetical protein
MSAYTVTKLPDEPVILIKMTAGFSIAEHLPAAIRDTAAQLDVANERVSLIYNALEYPMPSISDLVDGTNRVARGAEALFKHPNIREIITVTDRRIFELTMKGLNTELFGFVKSRVFHSMEEALVYAHGANKNSSQVEKTAG